MSRFRSQPHPWLADHMIYASYRWATWLVALAIFFSQGEILRHGTLLMVTALVNTLATLLAQPYLRAARRNPALLILDLLYTIPVLLTVEGWTWAFLPYALSSLVAPALVYGWRGGLMAGLTFASLQLAVSGALGRAPLDIIDESGWVGGGNLLLILVVPPLFGTLLPTVVELARHLAARYRPPAHEGPPPFVNRANRDPEVKMLEQLTPLRSREFEQPRSGSAGEAPAPLRTAAIGAPENGLEETRRVIFAPFPSSDLDLPAVLELLATRFGQHASLATRVSLLGRTRYVHPAQRAVMIRLVQEALLNVQHHAHAEVVELTLRYDASSVMLLIQDNGVGLLDGTYERPGLHALRAMQYRLAELGGRLDVFEAQSGGVIVRATVPLDA